MGTDVAAAVISQRVALSHAIIAGKTVSEYEPNGKAAAEIAALSREIEGRLNEQQTNVDEPRAAARS